MIGLTNSCIRRGELIRCIAMHGHNEQCPKEAEVILEYQIQGRLFHSPFCEDDAYEHLMYLSNYLGVKVRAVDRKLKEKVEFT
jgi:hypothetical protein